MQAQLAWEYPLDKYSFWGGNVMQLPNLTQPRQGLDHSGEVESDHACLTDVVVG